MTKLRKIIPIFMIALALADCSDVKLRESRPTDGHEGVDGYIAEEKQVLPAGVAKVMVLENTEIVIAENTTKVNSVVRLRLYPNVPEENIAAEIGAGLGDVVSIEFLTADESDILASSILESPFTINQRLEQYSQAKDLKMIVVTDPGLDSEKTNILDSSSLKVKEDAELGLLLSGTVSVQGLFTNAIVWFVESDTVPTTIKISTVEGIISGGASDGDDTMATKPVTKTEHHFLLQHRSMIQYWQNSSGDFETTSTDFTGAQAIGGVPSLALNESEDVYTYLSFSGKFSLFGKKTSQSTFEQLTSELTTLPQSSIGHTTIIGSKVFLHHQFLGGSGVTKQSYQLDASSLGTDSSEVYLGTTGNLKILDAAVDKNDVHHLLLGAGDIIYYVNSSELTEEKYAGGLETITDECGDNGAENGRLKIDANNRLDIVFYCVPNLVHMAKTGNDFSLQKKITYNESGSGVLYDFVKTSDNQVAIAYLKHGRIHLTHGDFSRVIGPAVAVSTTTDLRLAANHDDALNLFVIANNSNNSSWNMTIYSGTTAEAMSRSNDFDLPGQTGYGFSKNVVSLYK